MQGSTPTKKELVKVGGQPILWHVMKIYAAYGHDHFILTLGYEADQLKRYFMEYEPMSANLTLRLGQSDGVTYHRSAAMVDWTITLVDTGRYTQKGSRVRRVADHIDTDTFFLTYGDGVGDVDIEALLAFHRHHGRLATVTAVHPHSQYGILKTTAAGQVTGFGEKPVLKHWINAGFMVIERAALDYFGEGDDVDLERQVLPQIAAEGQLMAYRHTGFWRSMDTFKEALALDEIWRTSAPWKMWE